MDVQRYGWSFPVGRIFGIPIRVHLLFVVFVAVELLNAASLGWFELKIAGILCVILWGSVLLHELGHCYAGIKMGGQAEQILLWPLGGLASIDVPRMWRQTFWTAFAGPFVTFLLCVAGVVGLLAMGEPDPFNPYLFWNLGGALWFRLLYAINSTLLILNLLPLFPLDGGRMAHAFLWRKWGYGQGTLITVKVAKVFAVLLAIYGLWKQEWWVAGIAIFCYFAAEQERVALEMGAGEEGFMGYDFSNGYTSLEASSPRPVRRTSLKKRISRWFSSRRAEKQAKREKDEEDELKARVDSLLEKIGREGMAALSTEERNFLNEASKHYRM